MRELPADAEHHLPFGKEQIAGPLLQRQVDVHKTCWLEDCMHLTI